MRLPPHNDGLGSTGDSTFLKELVVALFQNIPSGVGSKGSLRLTEKDERQVLQEGAAWAVHQGYGIPSDLTATEDGGCMAGADPDKISPGPWKEASRNWHPWLGQPFLEIEAVEEIYDHEAAAAFGLEKGQVAVLLHSGSAVWVSGLRRLSGVMMKHVGSLGFELPDRQLACAWIDSREGRDYMAAMACAANYAWANRQLLMHWTRKPLKRRSGKALALKMRLLYDVCHNIAKIETFPVAGRETSSVFTVKEQRGPCRRAPVVA